MISNPVLRSGLGAVLSACLLVACEAPENGPGGVNADHAKPAVEALAASNTAVQEENPAQVEKLDLSILGAPASSADAAEDAPSKSELREDEPRALLPLATSLDATEQIGGPFRSEFGLEDLYQYHREFVTADILIASAAQPIFAECEGTPQPGNCHVEKCRSFAEAYAFADREFGRDETAARLRGTEIGPAQARTCAYALANAGAKPIREDGLQAFPTRVHDAQTAFFLFDLAQRTSDEKVMLVHDALDYSLFTARGAEDAADAKYWLDVYAGIVGDQSQAFAEAKDRYDFVQFFWSKWDVTERLGVNMGDPVTLGGDFDRFKRFRSGGREFTVDDVVDRYYEINRPGWRNGLAWSEAFWGNGFYVRAFTTDNDGTILIRVDIRTYEVTVDFLFDGEIDAMNEKVRGILDYAQNGNAHRYNWDADGLRKFISEDAQPFHEWYDVTMPSAEFYQLSLRDRINHIRARGGMEPLPESWRLH